MSSGDYLAEILAKSRGSLPLALPVGSVPSEAIAWRSPASIANPNGTNDTEVLQALITELRRVGVIT